MDILNNIIEYFPKIGKYVQLTSLLYTQIAPIIKAISQAKDCELFPPSSISIKKALEESGDFNSISIIEKLGNPMQTSNTFILDDPYILQNQRIGDIIQNINLKFYSELTNNTSLLQDSILNEIFNNSVSIGDPCAILEEDILDAIKRKQTINSDFKKT